MPQHQQKNHVKNVFHNANNYEIKNVILKYEWNNIV